MFTGKSDRVWTLLGAIGSLLIALTLSFLAVLVIAVIVLIWLVLMASTTPRSS